MPTILAKIKQLGVLCIWLLACWNLALAQENSPAPTKPVQTQSESAAGEAYRDVKKESGNPTALDYFYKEKAKEGTGADSVNKMSGVLADKLKALDSVGQDSGMDADARQRFSNFLHSKPYDEKKVSEYQKLYARCLALIKEDRISDAMAAMIELDQYPWDNGFTGELVSRVQVIFDAEAAAERMRKQNAQLTRDVEIYNGNADLMVKAEKDREDMKSTGSGSKNKEKSNSPTSGGGGSSLPQPGGSVPGAQPEANVPDLSGSIGKLTLTEEYLKSFEAKVKIKRNEIKMDMKAEAMKTELSDYISILHTAKRYHLVILAANLYRQVFGEGDYPVKLSSQVDTAVEATRRLEEGVEVFRFKMPRGEYAGASAALQSAFIASELNPELRSIPLEDKLKMASLQARMDKIRNYVEARDFAALEKVLSQTEEEAKDFEGAKARSLVQGIKLESQMRLGSAKLAAQDGNRQLAMDEFRAAAEAWPGNPELQAAAGQFFSAQDSLNKGKVKLDDLIAAGNYREIAARQLEFLVAIQGNADQEKKFRQALEKVRDAEIALEKAELMQRNGDFCGAWETVDKALDVWPDDAKLNNALGKYSIKSAEFISLLDRAKTAENQGNSGQSLSLYANALGRYPGSFFAKAGMERLTSKILAE